MTETEKLIRIAAEKYKDNIAYTDGNIEIGYKELIARSDYLANLLKNQGNSPVVIYMKSGYEFLSLIIACIFAGRTYIPVDISTPAVRLEQIVKSVQCDLVISDTGVKIEGVDCVHTEELKSTGISRVGQVASDAIYIIFTSGSTGNPKGVPVSDSNLNNFISWISNLTPLSSQRNIRVYNQANFGFDLSVAGIYYSLCNGHTLCLTDDKFGGIPDDADAAVITPTFAKLCLLDKEFNNKKYKNLKTVYFCGEQLSAKTVGKLFDSFPDLRILNAYGPTEATSAVSATEITKQTVARSGFLPCGDIDKAAVDITIENGIIILCGKSVSNGYTGINSDSFTTRNGLNCFNTGDSGFIENGKLYCKGRNDSQIKYMGYRIELTDIENNICDISNVSDCAVTVKYGDSGEIKAIQAYVTGNITAEEVREKLSEKIPSYMIPKTIKITDKLPVNPNGKTDRKALTDYD
jgi:D-alanine--poly(phosphoribitol) ligase subunit 1